MNDDLLERATAALRETGADAPHDSQAAEVRERVVAHARRRRKLRPHGVWQWAAVAIASLCVSTAMAHVIRVQLPRVLSSLRSEPTPELTARPKSPSVAPRPRPAASQPEAVQQTEVAPASSNDALELAAPKPPLSEHAEPERVQAVPARPVPSVAVNPAPPPARRASEKPPARSERAPEGEVPAAVSSPAPAPAQTQTQAPSARAAAAESAELALFRRAQSLHLAHDPRAIAAWDAYLRVVSAGALVPEARYNRALALVRVHRYTEARTALQPFAEGQYGNYRRQEARALLARLP